MIMQYNEYLENAIITRKCTKFFFYSVSSYN